jgi:hypothetical protein
MGASCSFTFVKKKKKRENHDVFYGWYNNIINYNILKHHRHDIIYCCHRIIEFCRDRFAGSSAVQIYIVKTATLIDCHRVDITTILYLLKIHLKCSADRYVFK